MTRTVKTVPAIPALFAVGLAALTGCSTVKSLSPFDGAPYAQDIKPTVSRPTQPDKPVYPVAPKATTGGLSAPVSPLAQAAARDIAVDGLAGSSTPAPITAGDSDKIKPGFAADRRKSDDDGTFPNLAQVPARPSDLPSFADAHRQVGALQADRAAAALSAPSAAGGGKTAAGSLTARPEDRSPCLAGMPAAGAAKAAVSFAVGSSTLTDEARASLADAVPDVRAAQGEVRIVGDGDRAADSAPPTRRFNLAMARASSVALALTEFGISSQRIAVGVSCSDTALSGPSVRLYLDS